MTLKTRLKSDCLISKACLILPTSLFLLILLLFYFSLDNIHKHEFAPIIFLAGGFFAILFSFMMYLLQKLSCSVKNISAINDVLKKELDFKAEMETTMHEISSRLDLATRAGQIGVWSFSLKDNKLKWNSIMYELYNVPLGQDVTYENWRSAVVENDLQHAESQLNKSIKTGNVFDTQFRINGPNNTIRYIKAMAKPEKDQTGQVVGITGVNWDITAVKEAEAKIEYAANHDILTGLPSLRMVKERVAVAFSLARRHKKLIALMFLDLDGFKPVNDTYGHDVGDCVLKETACRFKGVLRESDTVGRIGGDEFVFILNDIESFGDAEKVAQKTIEAVGETIVIDGKEINIGISIGIAFYPGDGHDVESLIKEADRAMYEVKKTSKNSYAFA